MMTAYISPGLAKAGVFQGKVGLFGLTDQASFVAATFLGLFIGTIAVTQVADRFGRQAHLRRLAALVHRRDGGDGLQHDAIGIDVWRLIAGIGIGVELVTIDTYITEIAPRSARGRAFAVNQCDPVPGRAGGRLRRLAAGPADDPRRRRLALGDAAWGVGRASRSG